MKTNELVIVQILNFKCRKRKNIILHLNQLFTNLRKRNNNKQNLPDRSLSRLLRAPAKSLGWGLLQQEHQGLHQQQQNRPNSYTIYLRVLHRRVEKQINQLLLWARRRQCSGGSDKQKIILLWETLWTNWNPYSTLPKLKSAWLVLKMLVKQLFSTNSA